MLGLNGVINLITYAALIFVVRIVAPVSIVVVHMRN